MWACHRDIGRGDSLIVKAGDLWYDEDDSFASIMTEDMITWFSEAYCNYLIGQNNSLF